MVVAFLVANMEIGLEAAEFGKLFR
jgi:hypothetical protein